MNHIKISPCQFRWLLGFSLAFIFATFTCVFADGYLLPEELAGWDDEEVETAGGAYILFVLLVILPLFCMTLISYVGLFLLEKWGRLLFLASNVLCILALPFLGPTVESALSSFFGELTTLTTGLVIAASYFTPLFDRPNTPAPPPLP